MGHPVYFATIMMITHTKLEEVLRHLIKKIILVGVGISQVFYAPDFSCYDEIVKIQFKIKLTQFKNILLEHFNAGTK